MSSSSHSTLFQLSGPGATLDYLWSRLGSHDLAQDEALALLSAVHRELGQSKAEDPSAYVSYSRFMEALNRQMPVVHDFVVSKWSESRFATHTWRQEQDDEAGEPDAEVDRRSDPSALAEVQRSQTARSEPRLEVVGEREELDDPGEPEEEGEPDESGGEAQEAKERHAEDIAEDDEPEEEPEAEEANEKKDEEEPEEIEDFAEGAEAQEEGEEAEEAEAENDEQEEAEGEDVAGEEEPAEAGETEDAEQPEAEATEGEQAEKSGEEEGSELPEELEVPEPLAGEEGNEGEEAGPE